MYKELNKLRAIHGSYDDLLGGTGSMPTTDFSQADMGDNPTVNLATGRLRYSFDDLSVGYGSFAVNVGHVYLSQHFSAFVNKFPELSSGWKLNVAQYVVADKTTIGASPVMLYMDEAGEVHRFVALNNSIRCSYFRDERNAKITLSIESDSSYIEDGAGNRIYFNRQGRVSKTVSCHNNTMMKWYEYDEKNRLVKVYDYRRRKQVTHTSYNIGAYIEFGYDEVDRLSSATAYSGRVLSSVNYGYDSNGRLTQVDRIAYNRKGAQCLVTPSLGFEYTNGLLTQATDLETKSAYRFDYANGKVSRVEQGVVGSDSVGTGAADADGNSLAYCGNGLYCGALTKTEFVRKASNSYTYYYEGGDTRIASEADVTNHNGITLAYFINRNACVTSAFERAGANLKTLDKQGAKRANLPSDSNAITVNGVKQLSASGTLSVLENAATEITRNDREQGLRTFNYSFWLNLPQKGEYMQAKATYKFTSGAEQTSTVFIDGKAVNAWQAVSLPLYAPLRDDDDTKTDTLSYLKINLLSDAQQYTGEYGVAEIGFAPAPVSNLYLRSSSGYTLSLTDVTSVMLGETAYDISKDLYFTESDVVATFTNKYRSANATFTVISNNGTKRRSASSVLFSSGSVSSVDNTAPFVLRTDMTDGKTQITAKYTYNAQSMLVTTEGKHENTSSSTSVEIDYLGKTLKETDEYGVSKHYYYNDYGDVIRMQVVGSDGVVGSTVAYNYDSKGRLTGSHDGLTGQKVAYTEYDQVGTVTECKVSGDSLQETPHKAENTYGVFRDNALAVTEYDGSEQQARNCVTYEQGRIRTVTDGLSKYGVKYDLANGRTDYTHFGWNGEEQLVQRDKVLEVSGSGSSIRQKHRSEFYENNAVKDTVTTEVTKYGKVNAVAYKSGTNAETRSYYTYDNPTESGFAAVPTKLVDRESGTTTEYSYDADGNLTGWKQYENAPSNQQQFALTVKQLYANSTEYDFAGDDIYKLKFKTGLEYDTDKLVNPRLAKITNSKFPLFNQHYEYDNLGRIIGKDNVNHSRYMYSYTTQGGVALLTSNEYKNYYDEDAYNFSLPRVHMTEQLSYTDQGDLSGVTQSYSWTSFKDYNNSQNIKCNWQSAYEYDNLHRLTKETNTAFNIQRQYSYDNYGRMKSVVDKNGFTKSNTYDIYGRLSSIGQGDGNRPLGYDNYGNCTSYNGVKYSYKRGNLLTSVDEYDVGWTANIAKYEYDVNGVRSKKVVGSVTTKYYYDGNKLLGEERIGTEGGDKHFRYAYDNDGIMGVVYQGSPYLYVKDGQGNVAMLLYHDGKVAARYVYDAWGNCKVYDENNNLDTVAKSVGNLNPIRWKGHYYDVETGLYYINGSYYNPAIGRYMDASPIQSVADNALKVRSLDRNGILCNNILELAGNPYTVQTSSELQPDIQYDPNKNVPIWYKISKWYKRQHWLLKLALGIVLLKAAVALTVASGGSAGAIFVELAIGIGFGVAGYLLSSLLTQQAVTWSGLGNAVLDSFLFTSAFLFVSSSINAIKYLCRSKPVTTAELANNNGIQELAYDDMLPNEKLAYDGYSKHGWQGNYPGQAQGIRAGKVYSNNSNVLPQALYREFDINPAIQGIGRDASRFVVSDNFTVYLTRDHYVTFYKIIP